MRQHRRLGLRSLSTSAGRDGPRCAPDCLLVVVEPETLCRLFPLALLLLPNLGKDPVPPLDGTLEGRSAWQPKQGKWKNQKREYEKKYIYEKHVIFLMKYLFF